MVLFEEVVACALSRTRNHHYIKIDNTNRTIEITKVGGSVIGSVNIKMMGAVAKIIFVHPTDIYSNKTEEYDLNKENWEEQFGFDVQYYLGRI